MRLSEKSRNESPANEPTSLLRRRQEFGDHVNLRRPSEAFYKCPFELRSPCHSPISFFVFVSRTFKKRLSIESLLSCQLKEKMYAKQHFVSKYLIKYFLLNFLIVIAIYSYNRDSLTTVLKGVTIFNYTNYHRL